MSASYLVFTVEDDQSVGLVAPIRVREYLLSQPNSLVSLWMHRLYKEPTFWPHQLKSMTFELADHMHAATALNSAVLCWGSFILVNKKVKQLLVNFGASSYFSPCRVQLRGESVEYMTMYLYVPALGIDAIDRGLSEYTEEPDDPERIRIYSLSKLVVAEEQIVENPPMFQLGGTSLGIILVREDLCEALLELGLNGLNFKPIKDCTWDY